MKLARSTIDNLYELAKPLIFLSNPNRAHRAFTKLSQLTTSLYLEKFLLSNPDNHQHQTLISNAAGFTKDGEISLPFLYQLGLNRAVIGTITGEPNEGNPEPNIMRIPKTNSMLNWMALPGKGASEVADTLYQQVEKYYGSRIENGNFPITINLMATPGSTTPLRDLSKTIELTRDLTPVDRYELNISCPNTEALSDFNRTLEDMIMTCNQNKNPNQKLYLKLSPDTLNQKSNDPLTEKEVVQILNIAEPLGVAGYTTTNTTRYHDPKFIKESPGKGGASGDAAYQRSRAAQILINKKLQETGSNSTIIACGGIDSIERLKERTSNFREKEIQILAPLINKGPKLITKLLTYK